MSYLQTLVDEDPRPGRFILTGSHQLMLLQAIAQSLSGRVNLITLLPFSLEELKTVHPDWSLDHYLLQGFYPRIYQNELNPTEAYRNYFKTYLEQDLRLIINVKDLLVFERFLKLCAGRIGQLINYAALANEVGVSSTTIKEWLSVLEASFIIKLLPPYFENFGKRITKSPKLYFIDVGFAAYLLDIHNETQLNRDPLRGALVENMVIIEILKYYLNKGIEPSLYFYRENNGVEIDLLLKQGNQLIPFEIKSAKTFHEYFLKHLYWFKKLLHDRVPQSFLVYDGKSITLSQEIDLVNWHSLSELIQEKLGSENLL